MTFTTGFAIFWDGEMKQGKILMVAAIFTAMFMLAMNVASRAQPAPSPKEQALSSKLSQEINNGLQCVEQLVTVNQQLAAAQAEVKRLTDKYESKPEPKK